MVYDITDRVQEAWTFYDEMLTERISKIAELAGVPEENFVKINPAEFIERNKFQKIREYTYQDIGQWIERKKTDNGTFLVSPLDAIEETAAQCAYKSNENIRRTLRASKCEICPVPVPVAKDFFIRNHRQTVPNVTKQAVSLGLVFQDELVAVMLYDIQNGAIRGKNKAYELLRLSISKGTRVQGGASKLQKASEEVFKEMGVTEIFSYSNATINSGAVYEKLGFTPRRIIGGQPFVIMGNNDIVRLITLHPESTDEKLARHNWIKTHVGGNRFWLKHVI